MKSAVAGLYSAAVRPTPAEGAPGRLTSLDAFRGLVILTMTFVNYLGHVQNIPAWARHVPQSQEGYTFVDVVFPAFLFIVGVAIPLALHKRMARGESTPVLLQHICVRSAALLLLGVIMVNGSFFSREATGMSKGLWSLLTALAAIVIWNAYPPNPPRRRKQVFLALRVGAALALAALLIIFRGKNADGQVVWLQHAWWGILGLIGWAYLVCCLAYLCFRGSSVALMGVLGFLIALYIGDKHGALDWLGPVRDFIGVGAVLGSTAANVMIGVLVGNCFVGEAASLGPAARVRFVLTFGVGLYLAGTLLRPLHGINKVAATDSYALVTGGVCCLSFLLVYCAMDVAKMRGWATPLIPIGQNAVLAYMLPGMLRSLGNVLGLPTGLAIPEGSGWPGTLHTTLLTVLVMVLTWTATRLGVRLRL